MMGNDTDLTLKVITEQSRQAGLTDRQALEELVIDNPDMERLEALLDQFNLFEAIGGVRQEERHSNFLAFLLDPHQNHGLGDEFAKRLLQNVLKGAQGTDLPINLIDLDVWSLADMTVLREWNDIDILLLHEKLSLAVIVENKIMTGEHSNQLCRYRATVEQQHPAFHILGLFLTVDGSIPSDDRYLPLSYKQVAETLETVMQRRASVLGSEVRMLMNHYVQMIRRHIMSGSDVDILCQRIYQKHKRALDLIFERRPDQQAEIKSELEKLIKATPGLVLDSAAKTSIKFVPQEWDVPLLQQGAGWTPSGRILLFEFFNSASRLSLYLYIGPGPLETRQRLFDMTSVRKPLLKPTTTRLNNKWNAIYVHHYLKTVQLETADMTDLITEIHKHWTDFTARDLPAIQAALREETWLWSEVASDGE